jgi:hypothetical protein
MKDETGKLKPETGDLRPEPERSGTEAWRDGLLANGPKANRKAETGMVAGHNGCYDTEGVATSA